MKRKLACGVSALAVLLSALPSRGEQAATTTTSPAGAKVTALADWQFSGDDGATWTAQPPIVPGGKVAVILARTRFDVPDPTAAAFWQLLHALPPRLAMSFLLNGREVPVPLKGMYYQAIPAIPAALLKRGGNELAATIRIDNHPPSYDRLREMEDFTFPAPAERAAFAGQVLAIQSGPILGAFGEDFFTVTCRTSIPATVALYAGAGGQQGQDPIARSGPGLFHRFLVKGAPNKAEPYLLEAEAEGSAGRATAGITRPVFPRQGLRLVILGDSRTNTDDWAEMAAAALREKSDLLVFTGDMCSRGTNDWEWDEHFFAPEAARKLLASVPFYCVKGNHEEEAPLFSELFYTPSPDGKAENWAQQVAVPAGPEGAARPMLLLIGIDGQWSPTWNQTRRWLEQTLSESNAKFILLASHYPAWSSGKNGELDDRTGLPRHWAYVNGRQVVVPLLARYGAAALVVSHEHHYERSDLPGGLYQIISGGAGAPRSSRSRNAEKQNPYAKVFAREMNYCLFQLAGETCEFQAKGLDGEVLDRLSWKARPAK